MATEPEQIGKRGKRGVAETERALGGWLGGRLGVSGVEVSELAIPKAGFSNETILLRARWTGPEGGAHDERLVLRIEPTEHQVFLEPDALFQARMLSALDRHGLPVPKVWFIEEDTSFLGARFFMMSLVLGRIPPDVPSWHERGWATRLAPADRARLYDNGLRAVADLHRLEWSDGLGFLAWGDGSGPLDGYLRHVSQWYEWSTPSRSITPEIIEAAMDHVLRHRPAKEGPACVCWGDARPGNIIFAEDLSVAAMLDWEGATLGTPGIDLGWWLMFEEFLSVGGGIPRLEGVPGPDATVARYEELSGRPVADIGYYRVLAGLVLALINSRLAELLVARHLADPDFVAGFVTRVTAMLARWLDG